MTDHTKSQLAMMAARSGSMTARESAKLYGVHWTSVGAAKKVLRDAAPEVVDAIENGTISVHAARNIIKAVSKDKQAEAMATVLDANRGKPRSLPQASAVILGLACRRRSPAIDPNVTVGKCVDGIEVKLEVITERWSQSDKERWRPDLVRLRQIIAKLLKEV